MGMILVFLAYCFAAGAFNCVVWGCCDCDCSASAYVPKYEPEKKFPMVGMDIYVVDNINDVNEFKKKYGVLYSFDYYGNNNNTSTALTAKEERNLARFVAGEEKVLKVYNHYQDWCIHFYNLDSWLRDSYGGILSKFLTDLAKKLGTTGGNNFDYKNAKDVERWFESCRSKIRRNKNVLIFNLDSEVKERILEVVKTFKRMISFSYCPEIIFLHENDLNVNNLYEAIEHQEELWEVDNGAFYPPEGTHSNKGWLVRGDRFGHDRIKFVRYSSVDESVYNRDMGEAVRKICYFHNMADTRIKNTHINVALTGWKRSGKTTLGNLLVNARVGKSSNDFSSVTRKATVYHHFDSTINFSVVDTPGIEEGEDYAKLFLDWFYDPAENDNYEFYVTNEDMDFGKDTISFSVKNGYLCVSTDRGGANEKIVENLRKKGRDIIERPEKVRITDETGKQRDKIDIITKINGTRYGFSCVLSGAGYVAKKVKLNKDFIHCIVHLLAPRNFSLPENWSFSSFGGQNGFEGPCFKDDELALFKEFEKLGIPVIFAINFNTDPNTALICIRKLFADLALSNKFVDLDNPPVDGFSSSFVSPLHSRGTIFNLGMEGPNPKCGVTRLLQVIYESIIHARHYDGDSFKIADLNLPENYKNSGSLQGLSNLFLNLNAVVRGHGYARDETIGKNNLFFGDDQSPLGDRGDLILFNRRPIQSLRPVSEAEVNNHTKFDLDCRRVSYDQLVLVKRNPGGGSPVYYWKYPAQAYCDKFSRLFDDDLERCLTVLHWFATDNEQKNFWGVAKSFIRDVTNNWAIGNKYYRLPLGVGYLRLPQFAGYDNSKEGDGWHPENKWCLLN